MDYIAFHFVTGNTTYCLLSNKHLPLAWVPPPSGTAKVFDVNAVLKQHVDVPGIDTIPWARLVNGGISKVSHSTAAGVSASVRN